MRSKGTQIKKRLIEKTEQSETIKAAGYVRVSTEEQAIEGHSLENQASRIRAFADSQGWKLIEIYREEGHSGKVIDRPELGRMIEDIENSRFDVLLVYRVDRLTRRQKDLWYLLEDVLEAHGVGFKSVTEPFDTTTAQGKAFLGMLAVFAQLERDTIAERTKDTLANRRANGKWVGRPPFGYRITEAGELEKDPDRQKVIARVKRLRRRGRSYRVIARLVGVSYTTVFNLLNDRPQKRNRLYSNRLRTSTVN